MAVSQRSVTTRPGVCHVMVSALPELSGRDVVVAELARAQNAGAGHTALVVAAASGASLKRLRDLKVPFRTLAEGWGMRAWLRSAVRCARWDPSKAGANVLHAHGPRALYLVTMLRLLGRSGWAEIPFVYTDHGFPETVFHRLTAFLERVCCLGSDAIVACSTEQAFRLQRVRRIATRVVMVPNGIRGEDSPAPPSEVAKLRRRLGIPAGAPVVGAVGRLSKEKRHDVLIRACVSICRVMPDAHVVIVGSGPQRPRLEAMIAAAGLLGRAHLLGHVDDVRSAYGCMDVFAHPSDAEGLPLAVLEAMAAGLPVVATSVGGVPDLVAHGVTGLLVPRRAPGPLATSLLRLLTDEQARAEMGTRGRERFLGSFTTDHMRERLDSLYDRLFDEGSRKWPPSSEAQGVSRA
ncbi:glycosyltransferase family 4 protein [Streptomyces mirabilis]|uniref:glycosyltransferase family 4 protein n=1 Tax=Streptomyces mirabilis TaxID=68239 RepID=UPI003664F87D